MNIFKDMWERLDKPIKMKWALLAFLLLALAAGQSLSKQQDQSNDIQAQANANTAVLVQLKHDETTLARFQSQLRQDIVKSCQKNGNPLREVLQDQLRQNLQFSTNPKLVHLIFPTTDPTALDKLIQKGIVRTKDQLRTIRPVDCQTIYKTKK